MALGIIFFVRLHSTHVAILNQAMKLSPTIFFVLLSSSITAQQTYTYVDSYPSGKENCLAVEGGCIPMPIDWKSSLDVLIKKLNEDWYFLETGKGYWIGYTNDMFSIAARKDSAIQPLLNFIECNANERGKTGAIYCLHLIGINSRIVGRDYEEFGNIKARKALLYLLKYPNLRERVITLLVRDPWASDISKIFETFVNSSDDCWELVSGLRNYRLKNLPINQKIPAQLGAVKVLANPLKMTTPPFWDIELQLHEFLDSIKQRYNSNIIIEDTLFKSKLRGRWSSPLNDHNGPSHNKALYVRIEQFMSDLTNPWLYPIGSRFQYYVQNDKLFICSALTAKQRLLEWWKVKAAEEKILYEEFTPLLRKPAQQN